MPTPLHRGASWLSPTRKRTEPDDLSYAPNGDTPRGECDVIVHTDTADESFIGGYRWQRSGLAVGSPGRNGGGGCSRVSSR
jgi:hypothetical protein